MKKIQMLMLVVAFCFVGTVQAQTKFALRGGVNATDVKFESENFKVDKITGFNAGLGFEAMLGRGGLGIDAGLLYSQKGFNSGNTNVRNGYLEVPVNLKFKLGIPKFNPYIAAGPSFAYRITGDKTWNIQNNAGVMQQVEAKNFGIGFNVTAGVELFDALQVGATLDWGTNEYFSPNKGYPRAVGLVAAIYF